MVVVAAPRDRTPLRDRPSGRPAQAVLGGIAPRAVV